MVGVWRYYFSLTVVGLLVPTFTVAKSLDSVLQILNQPATPASSYPTPVDENLTELNASELRQILQGWNKSPEKNPVPGLRERRNRFFQTRVQSMNASVLQWIQQAGDSASDHHLAAEQVLKKVAEHSVASIEKTVSRERAGEIGYCFGRALLVHYELLAAGVPQRALVKVFALGELSMDKQLWRFHVTAGVRDPKLGILVVDPLFPQVRSLTQWIQEVEALDFKAPFSRTRFYITDPRKFLPAFGAYHKDQLSDPILRSYFQALADSL